MTEFLLAILVMGLVLAGMAIGVICGRKPLAGSCGGLAALGMKESCEVCGGDEERCREVGAEAEGKGGLAYDATRVGK